MRQSGNGYCRGQCRRFAVIGFILTGLFFATLSTGCDNDAQSAFRQEAAEDIGSGVKTIVDAIIDGFVAAIADAGDGSSDNSSSSSSSSS